MSGTPYVPPGSRGGLLGLDRSTTARYESGARSVSVDTLMQVAQFLHRPVTMFLPGVYVNEGLYVALQVLERRPDLLPRVIDLLKVSLQGEAERNSERKTRFALCR